MTRIAAILWILSMVAAEAAPAKILRYVSQRPDKAYLREGPTYAHKVLWVYRHRGYPFAVIGQFDTWRRVQTMDGTLGWMNASMLTDKRTVLVTGKGRAEIRKKEDTASEIVGMAEPDSVLGLKSCGPEFCRVRATRVDGWIARARIWGVDPGDVFK